MSETRSRYDEMADRFIETMQWSEKTKDEVRTLVIGNVRGFVAFLEQQIEPCPECGRTEANKECMACGIKGTSEGMT